MGETAFRQLTTVSLEQKNKPTMNETLDAKICNDGEDCRANAQCLEGGRRSKIRYDDQISNDVKPFRNFRNVNHDVR